MAKLFGKLKHIGEKDPFDGHGDLCFLKHFRIMKRLGSGSYSHVYHVRRIDDGREYALKATDMSKLSNVERISLVEEIRYLASLDHPNIVRYYEAFIEQQWLCIITELVLGGDVARLISIHQEENRPISEDKIWSIFIQTALALEELHNCKIMHRDVKPENLLLNQDWIVKLTDFGISRILDHIFTRTQIGTPYYMSPEMWARKPYSLSSDIWALGCVTLELCILSRVFDGQTEAEVRRNVETQAPPLTPARYSDDLDYLIRRMLDPNPIERPTATELLAMPSVKRRWHLLPRALVPALHNHEGNAPQHHILRPIAVPPELSQLNAVLPPAQYGAGEGMAFLLSRPMSSSDTNLKDLDDSDHKTNGMTRSSSISNFEAAGHTLEATDVPGARRSPGLRRKSVQVAAILRAGLPRTNSASKGLGWVCDSENGDPCFLPGKGTAKARSFASPAAIRVRSPLTDEAPARQMSGPLAEWRRWAGSEGAINSSEGLLRTKSISVADPGGRRTRFRSTHAADEELLQREMERAVSRVTSFDLCPVSRKSFYVPQTQLSRNSIIRRLPEAPAGRVTSPRAPGGVPAGGFTARTPQVQVAQPIPAKAEKKKKGGFFKRIFS